MVLQTETIPEENFIKICTNVFQWISLKIVYPKSVLEITFYQMGSQKSFCVIHDEILKIRWSRGHWELEYLCIVIGLSALHVGCMLLNMQKLNVHLGLAYAWGVERQSLYQVCFVFTASSQLKILYTSVQSVSMINHPIINYEVICVTLGSCFSSASIYLRAYNYIHFYSYVAIVKYVKKLMLFVHYWCLFTDMYLIWLCEVFIGTLHIVDIHTYSPQKMFWKTSDNWMCKYYDIFHKMPLKHCINLMKIWCKKRDDLKIMTPRWNPCNQRYVNNCVHIMITHPQQFVYPISVYISRVHQSSI